MTQEQVVLDTDHEEELVSAVAKSGPRLSIYDKNPHIQRSVIESILRPTPGGDWRGTMLSQIAANEQKPVIVVNTSTFVAEITPQDSMDLTLIQQQNLQNQIQRVSEFD